MSYIPSNEIIEGQNKEYLMILIKSQNGYFTPRNLDNKNQFDLTAFVLITKPVSTICPAVDKAHRQILTL